MKKLKLTKEQYNKLKESGLLKEGSTNVIDNTFKKEFSGKPISNLNYVGEEEIQAKDKFNINIQEVEDLIKYVYGVNESISPYWSENNLTYEQLCETLEKKGLFVKKENTYRIPKSLGSPEFSKKAIQETLSEIIGSNMKENYPAGAEFHPDRPWDKQVYSDDYEDEPQKENPTIDGPLKTIASNYEISILTDGNNSFVFLYGDLSEQPLSDQEINQYVQTHKNEIGYGINDWDSGNYRLIQIDGELKKDLISLYDKDKNFVSSISTLTEDWQEDYAHINRVKSPEEQAKIDAKVKAIRDKELSTRQPMTSTSPLDETEIDETTTAASSGSFVAPLGGPIKRPNPTDVKVVSEMEVADAGNFQYDTPGLVGISRDGKYSKNPPKTKAQKNTQWAGGSFVEFDECTKLNNNKKAQNGGCSNGAVDNVIKQTKTKGNINAPSLSEGRKFSIYKLEKIVKK